MPQGRLIAQLGRVYNKLPSDIADPDRAHLDGLDRVMFDVVMTAATVEDERIAAGDTEGMPAEAQVQHTYRDLDPKGLEEYSRLEELKKKLRTKA